MLRNPESKIAKPKIAPGRDVLPPRRSALCPGLSRPDARPRGVRRAAREVPGAAAAQLDRGPALGAAAHDVERHRIRLPAGLGLLLPDRDRRGRRDGGLPAERAGAPALRPLPAAPRRPPRGLGRACASGPTRRSRPTAPTRPIRSSDFCGKMRIDADRATRSGGYPRGDREALSVRRRRHRVVGEVPRGVRSAQARAAAADRSTLVDARSIIHEMRLIKDDEDLRFLRRAAEMSAAAHTRARWRRPRPGKYEFEVQQALDGYCYANGARRMAYPVDRRLRPQLLHAPLRPEQPPDEGRRGPPERLRGRVRRLRDRHHAHVPGQRPLLAGAARDLRDRPRRAEGGAGDGQARRDARRRREEVPPRSRRRAS